jgi:hypothetical protein
VGLGGIEPPTSALSVLGKVLVRRLVYPVKCHFVPRRATRRRFVPLRLGTLWARRAPERAHYRHVRQSGSCRGIARAAVPFEDVRPVSARRRPVC